MTKLPDDVTLDRTPMETGGEAGCLHFKPIVILDVKKL